MRYLIYTRVSPKGSTWVGTETTVVDQADQCKAYVKATDPAGVIVDVITDEFESGGNSKRPGWMRILSELRGETATWDVLVVRHLDRFSRSIADAVSALELLHKRDKCLIATAQGLNSSTPSGRGVINILLSIAQMEREFGSERVSLKMMAIAQRGEWPVGNVPYGYKRRAKRDNCLVVDPEAAEAVQDIYTRYANGCGMMELAKKYKRSRTWVSWILRNKIYLGVLPYNGFEYPGKHEAIVTPEMWAKAQAAFPASHHAPRPKLQKYDYLLTGLVWCSCGRHMTPSSAHGRSKKYNYYACTDTEFCKSRVSAPDLEAAVQSALKKARVSEEDLAMIEASVRKRLTGDNGSIEELQAQFEKAMADRERLSGAFANGLVSKENAQEINKALAVAIQTSNDLEGRIAAARQQQEASPAMIEDVVRWVRGVNTLGQLLRIGATSEELRCTMSTWIKEIRRTEGRWRITLNLPGSSKCTEWWAMHAQGEPLRVAITARVDVFAA